MSLSIRIAATPGEIKTISLPEGSRIKDAFKLAGINNQEALTHLVRISTTGCLDTILSDEDTVILVKEPLGSTDIKYKHVSQVPVVERDLCFLMPESVASQSVTDLIIQYSPLIQTAEPVDVYRNPEKLGESIKSITWKITMQAQDRTLTGKEVDAIINSIVSLAITKLGITLRS